MDQKKALIIGITGQDGSYLAELLLSKGYEVHGLVRRSSSFNRSRIEHIFENEHLFLHYGDLLDQCSILTVINKISPDEIYNLGAQSHVRISFDLPFYTADSVGIGALRILDSMRHSEKKIKYYQASSSEMYGKVLETPQSEKTPFYPRSPYAISKVFAHWTTINYREAYGIFACNGILFNHESPRRGENFVTKKITQAVSEIYAGKRTEIKLGNLDASRDWGYAPEYVEAMWRMLQQNTPEDFVIATGETHSVREFLQEAFLLVGILDWEKYIVVDERLLRPAEVDLLVGDARKAKEKLGWEPKVHFRELVKIMMIADCANLGVELPK